MVTADMTTMAPVDRSKLLSWPAESVKGAGTAADVLKTGA